MDQEIKYLTAQLRLAVDALDFYSQADRYQSKSKKIKPRIIQDSGAIARRTVIKIVEMNECQCRDNPA